tara:strand:- start:6066 stop:8888 length:2823 start_codon:yes stop_codon:yes gene_type:complete
LEFVGAKLERPKFLEADGTSHEVTPEECHLRNLTYSIPLYTDVHATIGEDTHILKSVYMGRIPLMLGSKYDPNPNPCSFDPGGYFICKGTEKSIIFQKAHIHNCCLTLHRCLNGNDSYAICCKSEGSGVAVTTIKWNGKATVTFPKLKQEITVGTLLSLLPASSLVQLTPDEKEFYKESLEEISDVVLQDTFELGKSSVERMQSMLDFCLPHTKHKADFVRLMLKQLYRDMQQKRWSDKDSLMFQRIEMVHDLLSSLTHHLMRKMTHTIYQFLHRKMKGKVQKNTILRLIQRTTTLTDGLCYALATGNWNTPSHDGRQRVGVAQLLQRGTVYTAISQLRRISSSIKPEQKLSKPRFLHGTHRGRICYIETPEGASVGLESQLSIGAYVSIETPTHSLLEFVKGGGDRLVLINGGIVGYGGVEVATRIRSARRSGQISKDVSVTVDCSTVCVPNISIRTNSGRICRPLYILPKRDTGLSFTQMLSEGIVEYLDVYEENTMHIGTTHAEIDPILMLGFCAGITPYSNCNPGPRNTYQAAMLKQAQSVNSLRFNERFDTTNNVLHYGQKPLVSTSVERVYDHGIGLTGQNAIVAIMPFKYNQEDSIIMNKASIDRGFGRCTQLKTIKDTLCPDETYEHFPSVNTLVKKGDTVLLKKKTGYRRVEKKRVPFEVINKVETSHSGVVDKVLVYKERNGSDACKVRVRRPKVPEIGDKYASRSAQKGTIGLVVPQEDMPWTLDGITPDIILNPHAIPSRMTCAQIMECMKSKYGCYAGLQDGTPFNGDKAEDLMELLHNMGFKRNGTQVMMSGITGERFQVPIFIGPTFYQRLKHNSADKIHARGRGRKDFLTRQPNEGRANGGALRMGEMEKDALISHSVPHVLVERLMHSSDAYEMNVCACGRTHSIRGGVCNRCDRAAQTMTVPYAFKLLQQELQAMCIEVRLN